MPSVPDLSLPHLRVTLMLALIIYSRFSRKSSKSLLKVGDKHLDLRLSNLLHQELAEGSVVDWMVIYLTIRDLVLNMHERTQTKSCSSSLMHILHIYTRGSR